MSMSSFGWLCIFVIIFNGVLILNLEGKPSIYQGLSDKSILLYEFIDRQASLLGEKYELIPYGNGIEGMDTIKIMSLSFQNVGPSLNENQLRLLIVHLTEDLINAVNSSEELRPLLNNHPFTPQNLNVNIYFFDEDHHEQVYPNICCVGNNKGKIGFFTILKRNAGYHTKKYETFEASVTKLNENSYGSQ